MDNQDFEKYAVIKPFNDKVSNNWELAANDALARIKTSKDSIRILDYGCGDGKYFPFFVKKGFSPTNVFGLEVSQIRINRCKDIGWNNVKLVHENSPFPYNDSYFDVINCMEVIEHIPINEAKSTIARLRKLLRPRGCLIISTPNYPIKRFYDLYDALIHRKYNRFKDDPTHVTRFTHFRLRSILKLHFVKFENRMFKAGFLYKYFAFEYFKHKIFFLCQA